MSTRLIDLSHTIENGMPGFRMREGEGVIEYSAEVHPFRTHEQMRPLYDGRAEFEITELRLQTSVGTYIDAPYHRYPAMRDVSRIELDEVILPGLVVDVTGREPLEPVGAEVLDGVGPIAGHAVLFNFGWDRHWGSESYYTYPFIGRELIDRLIAEHAGLAGVDTINIDDARDPERPAHSRLLADEIFVVENLTRLDLLRGRTFRFFAVPLRVKGAAAMPVRAFAEITS
jgi:kynurenine formamidase